MGKKISLSTKAIIFITVFLLSIFFSFNLWNRNRILIDAPSYYAYLPSFFIYHDLHLNYVNDNASFFKDVIWFDVLPDGSRLIRYPIGVSLALSPFFLIGHVTAGLLGSVQDGYSMPYQNATSLGVLFYLVLGLHFLRKVLLNFFSEKVVALTLLTVTIGTNLLWYVTYEGLMSHGLSYSFLCIATYNFFQWLETKNKLNIYCFFLAFGMCLLIRLMSITFLTYFFIAGILMEGGFRNFLLLLKKNIRYIIIGLLVIFLIFLPQLFYWRLVTGHWFYNIYSNVDHQFLFKDPEWVSFLFGFRKGWLIYTPVMLFAIIGLWFVYKIKRPVFFATLICIVLTVYFLSSWWAWSYGICFGMRPMIDLYGFLAFPMAASFSFFISQKKIIKYLFGLILTLLIALNLFQSWQYKKGLIHFDWMTRESYFKGFFQTETSLSWYDSLKPYNWERRKKGSAQIEYSKKYFEDLKSGSTIYLRGSNLKFLETNKNKNYFITSTSDDVAEGSFFQFIRLNKDTIALRSSNQKFLSIKFGRNSVVRADADSLYVSEVFIMKQIEDGDNRVSLQGLNKKYLTLNPEWDNAFCALSDTVNFESTFRLYNYDDEK